MKEQGLLLVWLNEIIAKDKVLSQISLLEDAPLAIKLAACRHLKEAYSAEEIMPDIVFLFYSLTPPRQEPK